MSAMDWFRNLFGGVGRDPVKDPKVGDLGIGAQGGFAALEDSAAVADVEESTQAPTDPAP